MRSLGAAAEGNSPPGGGRRAPRHDLDHEGQSLRTIWLSEAYLLAGRKRMPVPPHSAPWVSPVSTRERTRGVHSSAPRRDRGARDPLDIGKAEDRYRQALALAEALGMRPLVAHCHVGLGKLYRRTGNLRTSEGHLTYGDRNDAGDGDGNRGWRRRRRVEGIGLMQLPEVSS